VRVHTTADVTREPRRTRPRETRKWPTTLAPLMNAKCPTSIRSHLPGCRVSAHSSDSIRLQTRDVRARHGSLTCVPDTVRAESRIAKELIDAGADEKERGTGTTFLRNQSVTWTFVQCLPPGSHYIAPSSPIRPWCRLIHAAKGSRFLRRVSLYFVPKVALPPHNSALR
jgi:hypothetical protein